MDQMITPTNDSISEIKQEHNAGNPIEAGVSPRQSYSRKMIRIGGASRTSITKEFQGLGAPIQQIKSIDEGHFRSFAPIDDGDDDEVLNAAPYFS